MERYQSFNEFWPFYLREHSKPATKLLHFVGTILLFGWLAAAVVQHAPLYVAAPVVNAYGFA